MNLEETFSEAQCGYPRVSPSRRWEQPTLLVAVETGDSVVKEVTIRALTKLSKEEKVELLVKQALHTRVPFYNNILKEGKVPSSNSFV